MPEPKKRIPLIAGNWKMHKTVAESKALAEQILASLGSDEELRLGLFPSAVSLAEVAGVAKRAGRTAPNFLVGAQNMYFETEGAFTGEISAEMIASAGGNAVILGHSERRHVFGETDVEVGKKITRALDGDLIPILCVGETIEERDAGQTFDVIRRQLSAGLERVKKPTDLTRVSIAYEPVWAIGTGRTATAEQAQKVHEMIRQELSQTFERLGGVGETSQETLILYGGSVKPENAGELLSQPDIDGALVGGASLKAESFLGIAKASRLAV